MKKIFKIISSFTLIALCLLEVTVVQSQSRIDGSFSFQSDPAKVYSIYIPSGYLSSVPNKMMVALHPYNPTSWNSVSWCDTLKTFAEMNNLILACPDGGTDGYIDDDIDTAFTSALIDSMIVWYNINTEKIFLTGFSWGGKTTYTYGLNHVSRFCGFLPIGSAMSYTTEVNSVLSNATGKPYYIVHGGSDSPTSRFYPIRDSLISNDAVVNWILIPGVGHTINFANRNQILTDAFQWIDSVGCNESPSFLNEIGNEMKTFVFPNPATDFINLTFENKINAEDFKILVIDVFGKNVSEIIVAKNFLQINIPIVELPDGIYFIRVFNNKNSFTDMFIKN